MRALGITQKIHFSSLRRKVSEILFSKQKRNRALLPGKEKPHTPLGSGSTVRQHSITFNTQRPCLEKTSKPQRITRGLIVQVQEIKVQTNISRKEGN